MVLELRDKLERAEARLEASERERTKLEFQYGNELSVNSELIDLCREHGIRYRKGLDITKWPK